MTAITTDIAIAAKVHLDVLAEFAAVVEARMEHTANPFAQDSLADLLVTLADQKVAYESLLAAAQPPMPLAA